MDSHSFRIVADELIQLLHGARVEKIHGPQPSVYVFTLFADGRKRRLLLRHERKTPLLFFCGQRLANPLRPRAGVMRLRKYCGGKRLGHGIADYASRRIAFPVSGEPGKEWHLLLDCVNGAFAVQSLPPGFGAPPPWPDAGLVDSLCSIPWQKREKEGLWQEYAVLTPLLRETLAALAPLEGRALLVDLEAGGGELFLYKDMAGTPATYTAWPLPENVCSGRKLRARPFDPGDSLDALAAPVRASGLLPDFPALALAGLADEPRFFADLGNEIRKEEKTPERRAAKKQSRLLAKLDQEQARLTAMLAQREEAKILQQALWQFGAEEKRDLATVTDANGDERSITLDPLLTVRENMARMFHLSARGARGLAMLEKRRSEILAVSANERGGAAFAQTPDSGREGLSASSGKEMAANPPASAAGPRALPDDLSAAYRHVGRFASSDGFILLRGKNAKGNQNLLKIGKGHDLWLHAEDGPSAHLIIRRSHASEDVPEATLREAATLVGEKSWQRNDAKARIMVAQLRHVHSIKGAAPGTVHVDRIQQSLIVALLPEERARENAEDVTEWPGEAFPA